MAASVLPWWFELTTQQPRPKFGRCPKCSGDVDSTDVLCPNDDVSLLGEVVSEERFPWLVNILRAVTAAVALAVGYLHWAWPVYVFALLVGGGIAGLFARNHTWPRRFLLGGIAIFGLAHWILMVVADGKYRPEAVAVFAVFGAVGELLFVFAFTRKMAADTTSWHPQHDGSVRTMLFGAMAISAMTVTAIVVLLARMLLTPLPPVVVLIGMYIVVIAMSAGTTALLASSIAYTLNAPVFSVRDPITYNIPLREIRLPRLRTGPPRHIHNAIDRFVAVLERMGLAFANAIVTALEGFYNRQIRGFVNGTVKTATALANAAYRGVVKTARHMHRTLDRFVVLARESAQWSWMCIRKYTLSFLAPAVLFWIAAGDAWAIGREVLGYVTGSVSVFTPLLTAPRAILLLAILAFAAGLLLQAPATAFATKVMTVVSAFSANAFLFFVALAWTLGVLGAMTDGPYRIGWVTLASTAIVIGIVGTAWWRGRAADPPTSP